MKHLHVILAVTMAFGCGTSSPPAQHAPPAVAQDDTSSETSPDAHMVEAPEPAFTASSPFTDLGPKCKPPTTLSTASLPVITSQEQLDGFLGCQTTLVVDWSSESVVPIAFEGVNTSWSLKGLSFEGGVTTITVLTDTMMRGAAVHERDFWLVRVPASTKSVVIQWKSTPQKADVHPYP